MEFYIANDTKYNTGFLEHRKMDGFVYQRMKWKMKVGGVEWSTISWTCTQQQFKTYVWQVEMAQQREQKTYVNIQTML